MLKAEKMKADPLTQRLRPITEDEALENCETAWTLRLVNDDFTYAATAPRSGSSNFVVTVLRSLWWPGAIVVS